MGRRGGARSGDLLGSVVEGRELSLEKLHQSLFRGFGAGGHAEEEECRDQRGILAHGRSALAEIAPFDCQELAFGFLPVGVGDALVAVGGFHDKRLGNIVRARPVDDAEPKVVILRAGVSGIVGPGGIE